MYNTRYNYSTDSAASPERPENGILLPTNDSFENASATRNAFHPTPQRVSTRESSRPPAKLRRTGNGPDTVANEVENGPSAMANDGRTTESRSRPRQEPVDAPSNLRLPVFGAAIPRRLMHVEFAQPLAHVRYFHTPNLETPMVDQDQAPAESSEARINEEESSPILHMKALRKPARTEIESHFAMKQAEYDMHRQIEGIFADADCEDTSEDQSITVDPDTQQLQQEHAEKHSELENTVRSYQNMLKGSYATDATLSMQKSFLRSIGTVFDKGLSSQCDRQAREIGMQKEEILLLQSKLAVSGTYEDLFHQQIRRVSKLQDCNDQLKQAAIQSLDEINIARKEAEDNAKLGRSQARRLIRLEEDLKFQTDQAHQLRNFPIPSWSSIEDDLQNSHELLRAERRRHIESRAKSQDVIAALYEKLRRVQGDSNQQLGELERQLHEEKRRNITLVNDLIETKHRLIRNETHDSGTQADHIIPSTADVATSTSEQDTVVRKDAGNLTSAEDFSRDASTTASLSCISCVEFQKQIRETQFENLSYRGQVQEQTRSFRRLNSRRLLIQQDLNESFKENEQIQSRLENSEKTVSLLRVVQKQIQEVRRENLRYRGQIEEKRRSFQRLDSRRLMIQQQLTEALEDNDQIQSLLETSEKTVRLLRGFEKQTQEVRLENLRYRGQIEEKRRSFQRLNSRRLLIQQAFTETLEENDEIQSRLATSEKTARVLRVQLLFLRWHAHWSRQQSQLRVEDLLQERFNDIAMIIYLLVVIVIFSAHNSGLSTSLRHASTNARIYHQKYILWIWQSFGRAGRNLLTQASLQTSIDENNQLNATNAGLAQEVDNLRRDNRSLIAKTALQRWKYATIQGKQGKLQIRLQSYASTNFYLIVKARILRREKDQALLDLSAGRRLVWRYAIISQQKQRLQALLDQSRARGLRTLVQVAGQLYHKERECAKISTKLHTNRMASLRLVYNVFLIRQKNIDLRDRIGISIARRVVEGHQQNQQSGQLRLRRILKAGLLLRKLNASTSALESAQNKHSTLITRLKSLGLSDEQVAPISDTGKLGLTIPPFRQVANAVVDVGDYHGTTSLLLGFGSSMSSENVLMAKCRCHDRNKTTWMFLVFDRTSDSVHTALYGEGWGSWAFCQEVGTVLANSIQMGFLWRINIPFEGTSLEWTLDTNYATQFKEWRCVLEQRNTT